VSLDGQTRAWLRAEVDRAARARLRLDSRGRLVGTRGPSRARAENFLLDRLAEGPRARAELVAEARALGISEWALGKAKASLGVEHDRDVPNRCGTTWRLPGWREGE
jgi:hypothetical protein